MQYFAYGSNLCLERLMARVPSARFVCRARLDGYALRFHKRGADGSGKANAYRTGAAEDHVWGAIFTCTAAEKRVLDRIEAGYAEEEVAVVVDAGAVERVRLYVAREAAIDAALLPFRWYKDYLVTGAEERGLPAGYVQRLRAQPAVSDPARVTAG